MKATLRPTSKANALFYCCTLILIAIVFIDQFASGTSQYTWKTQVDSTPLVIGIYLDLKSFGKLPLVSRSHPLISEIYQRAR